MIRSMLAALFSALFLLPAFAAEVQTRDITVGTGEEANVGETVIVHYTGWLMDGTKFDSSHDRNQPLAFTLGERRVIIGWEQGVEGMKVGGKRELIIPPELAYGERGAGDAIPPGATLKFEVELLEVRAKSYTDLDNDALKARIAAGTTIVDIRRPDEWQQTGVIPGSHLITFFDKEGKANPSFGAALQAVIANPAQEVVFICRTGSRSSVLSKYLAERAGFINVANVEKGIMDWIASGGEVAKPEMPEDCWLC
ncbi:FKBP-type peptidyl-prolyl cis-trans isomerase [Breoghania sp. L-A4]|uniref:FKBP-type peptidyl-prolyl cis-trans isomerase n=1 Tax=Breoghania sp. L-A4 TaxID=2304600 RepID=UPI000E35E0B0|nr:FKBP-type peptidyl-prolyl cis-trans isomerase [Breoghania sp. L-A4]AXS40023.1 peptidylprolyl isomerase [Breoghania sp. L-A4]